MRFIRYLDLKQLCLNVIIEHLEKYILSKNIPQKHIDFLHRVYSEEVFNKFRHKQYLTEEYILWFLNPYSKKVTLPIVSENIVKRLQEMGTTITSISLSESLGTENMINSILCCVPHLKELDLSSSHCTDRTMVCIQKMCPKIISLNLYFCHEVTNEGMNSLCGNNLSLRYLNLRGTSVKRLGVATILSKMPALQVLKYYDLPDTLYNIWEKEFKGNVLKKGKYNLTELIYEEVGRFSVYEVIQVWTILCPKVSKVVLDFGVTYRELLLCSQFKNLKHLKIICPTDASSTALLNSTSPLEVVDEQENATFNVLAPFLLSAKSLSTLVLTLTEIPTRMLMESFKYVKTLCLQNVDFTDFEEDDLISDYSNLDELVLKEITLDIPSTYKAIYFLLLKSKCVTKLRLTCIRSVPQNIWNVILDSMKNLSLIDFTFTPIEAATVRRFLQLPYLDTVFLDGCWNIEFSSDLKSVSSQTLSNSLSWCELDDDSDESDSNDDNSFKNLSVTSCREYTISTN